MIFDYLVPSRIIDTPIIIIHRDICIVVIRQRRFCPYFFVYNGLRQYLPNFGATIFNIDLSASHFV